MAKINFVKKLSIKSMGAIPEKLKEMENGQRIAVAHFIGRADGVETGVTSFGEWTALTGVFKGVNLLTGEVFRASKCFMPDLAVDEIASQLATLENDGDAIEFAVEIGIMRDIKLDAKGNETGIGYAYTMSPLIEADKASDPLAALESRIPAPVAALEDKSTETATEVIQDPKPAPKGKK